MTLNPIVLINEELDAAEEKHPHFCDALIAQPSPMSWQVSEAAIKAHNASATVQAADCIVMEEVAEAFAAIEKGDLKAAIFELAQCAAVCIRTMYAVNAEMERNKNETTSNARGTARRTP